MSFNQISKKRRRHLTAKELLMEIKNSNFSKNEYETLVEAIEEQLETVKSDELTDILVTTAKRLIVRFNKEKAEVESETPTTEEEIKKRSEQLHGYDRILSLLEEGCMEDATVEKEVLVSDPREGEMHYKITHNFTLSYADKAFLFEFVFEHSGYGYNCSNTSTLLNEQGRCASWGSVLTAWKLTDEYSKSNLQECINDWFDSIGKVRIDYFKHLPQ